MVRSVNEGGRLYSTREKHPARIAMMQGELNGTWRFPPRLITQQIDLTFTRALRSPKELMAHFPAVHPASIISSVPVTNALASLARYSAAAAISSGFAIRLSNCVLTICS